MKKIYLFMLMAVGLLISGNLRADGVCKIVETGNEYAILSEAIDAVKDGETIQLLQNEVEAATATLVDNTKAVIINNKKTFTLDLAGGTLWRKVNGTGEAVLSIRDCNITIKNGTIEPHTSSSKCYSTIKIENDNAIANFNNVTLGVKDSEYSTKGKHYGINLVNAKSLTINNDENHHIYAGSKTLNKIPCGVYVTNGGQTIGSIVNNSDAVVVVYPQNYSTAGAITIKDNVTNTGTGIIYLEENTCVPASKWDEWYGLYIDADKYTKNDVGNNYCQIVKKNSEEVSVTKNDVETKYQTLTAAMESIKEGETATIKLLQDITTKAGTHLDIIDGRHITLDLNEKSIKTSGNTKEGNDYFIYIEDGSLDIKNGIINCWTSTVGQAYESAIYLVGSKDKDAKNYSVLNVADDVEFHNVGDCWRMNFLIAVLNNDTYANGVKVNFAGRAGEKYESEGKTKLNPIAKAFMTINGTVTAHADGNAPEITITPSAEIYTFMTSIYAAGYGKWNIEGGHIQALTKTLSTSSYVYDVASSAAIEIRAGEMNINGGTFISDDTQGISCQPNGNGATTKGAALAISQHTTKQPVIVTINGGDFSALMAMIQVNPQDNSEEDYIKMKVNVLGGNFKSTHTAGGTLYKDETNYGTVTYATDAMCISQNKRIFLMGGFYNNDPVEFVATGYKRYPITESDYPEEYNAGYRFRIGEIDQAGETETAVYSGDWEKEATAVWQKEGSAGDVPTDETPVVIENDKQVVVTTPATAYSVTLGQGTSKLTVKETGRLMVGVGGFTGTTKESFIIENGGQMAISPSQKDYQPEATVTLVADWAHRKATADTKEPGALVAEDLYWQHIATPLSDRTQPTPSEQGVSYVNTWNLVNGWMSAGWEDVVTPFVGYQISSIKKSNEEKITLTFKGKLVGNHVDPMKFSRIGFSFFGNSYLAPIDIRELLTCLESKGTVDPTVLLYNSKDGLYESINRASYYIPGTKAEIQPMQGFFVFAESATNVDFDYRKAVWDAFCAKANGGATKAPAVEENPFSAIACIDIKAEDGAADRVMLFEGDELSAAEDKGYDAHKMMTSGMNIYAKGSYADLAILATDNLLGSELILKTDANTNYTMSFANIKGEYALYDALTGSTINMTEGATYEFQAQAEATISDRFFVVEANKAPTNMNKVNSKVGSCKFMKQGIMFIERNNKVYNAQGQIVK